MTPGPCHCMTPRPRHCMTPRPRHCMTPRPRHCRTPGPRHCRTPGPRHCTIPGPRHCTIPGPRHCMTPGPRHCMTPGPCHCMTPGPRHSNSMVYASFLSESMVFLLYIYRSSVCQCKMSAVVLSCSPDQLMYPFARSSVNSWTARFIILRSHSVEQSAICPEQQQPLNKHVQVAAANLSFRALLLHTLYTVCMYVCMYKKIYNAQVLTA